jgi:hypothetical protein
MLMKDNYDRLLSFDSIHHAIKAERLLRTANIAATAVPTPREISISCGQCLLFAAGDEEALLAILQTSQVRWSKLFCRDVVRRLYEKIANYGGSV